MGINFNGFIYIYVCTSVFSACYHIMYGSYIRIYVLINPYRARSVAAVTVSVTPSSTSFTIKTVKRCEFDLGVNQTARDW